MILRVQETRGGAHRELVHLRITVAYHVARVCWLVSENVWNATGALEEWCVVTLDGARRRGCRRLRIETWFCQPGTRLLDSVLEEEAAKVGRDSLLLGGLDHGRGGRRCIEGACQRSNLLLSRVCINGQSVNVVIFIFRVVELESR